MKLCLSLLILGLSLPVTARERMEFFNGARSLGMGGAQVAVVNDETALIANPAALGRLKDYFLTVVDPEVSINGNTERVVGTDVMGFLDPQEVLTELNGRPADLRFHQSAQVFPSFVLRNFGIGLYNRYQTDAFVDSTSSQYNFRHRNDLAVVMGFNIPIWEGRIKLGVTGRGVNRTEVDRTDLPTNSTGLAISNLATSGFGVGADVGLMFTAPVRWLPTLAAVYRDVGNTSYSYSDGLFLDTATDPETTPGTLDVGFSVQPIFGKNNRFLLSAELRDVMVKLEDKDTEDELTRRLHYGFEVNFKDIFFLRGGMNQGYYTAGLELAVMNYQLQFATYGEEVGTRDNEKEDRRYVAKFSWRY
jgi:hypothetical protein